jgi:hypothetical protein
MSDEINWPAMPSRIRITPIIPMGWTISDRVCAFPRRSFAERASWRNPLPRKVS